MRPLGVLTGLVLIAVGAYSLVAPESVRSFAKPREWRADPDAAEQKQRGLATVQGAVFVVLGLVILLLSVA